MRVLIIDDSFVARTRLRAAIEDSGCCNVVGELDRAEAATHAVGQKRPDLVVMDYSLPGHDGIWATRQVRVIFPNVDIVGFTTADDPDIHRRFCDAGAADTFRKEEMSELVDWIAARQPA